MNAIYNTVDGKRMAIHHILHYPDPRLRFKAAPIARVDDEIRMLIDDMLETMYAVPGIGLAAPQINISKCLIVIDISEKRNEPLALVNPEISFREGTQRSDEGCLSLPGISEGVERAARIKASALDRNGERMEIEAEGLLAICIQHEIDHLDGKLFVDYITEMKRKRIRKKLEKARRQAM